MPEPFLFVSHVSEDRAAALAIVEELERRGVRCWIAPRDVRAGQPFDDEIANALDACRAMLLIFSERCNDSEYIRREVTVAGESHKVVIPFRIENAEPKHGLRVRLSDLHWLDGFASREQAIDEVVRTFPAEKAQTAAEAVAEQPLSARLAKAGRRADERPAQPQGLTVRPLWLPLPLALAVGACLIVALIGIWAYPMISAYIKSKITTQVAVQPSPASRPTLATPAPAPTPAPRTTPPPPALPPFSSANCKPETASFYDDFHKPDPGWNITPGDMIHYADGQLVITPKQTLGYSLEYLALRYENTTICAHIQSPPDTQELDRTSGGIVFWATNFDNLYAAMIKPNGNYWISRKFAGNWINLIPDTKSAQIKTGTNAVNEVAITLVDNFGALFINNVKVQEFRGQPPKSGGAFGLRAESGQTASEEWRFLDIAVMDNGHSKPVALPPSPSGPTIGECRPVNATDFQDTFAAPDPGWRFNDPAHYYVDGQLSIKPNPATSFIELYRPLVFQNATVCVTVKSPPSVADIEDWSSGGAAFWARDNRNYYIAKVFPNGTFNVSRSLNGEFASVVPRTPSDAIDKGVGALNALQVVLNGANAALYINGTKVADFRGQPPLEGSAAGLYAQSEAHQQDEWRFLAMTVVENQ